MTSRPPAKTKVLVVDDSLLACNLVEFGLTELGYEVHCFQNPDLALDAIAQILPAIILSDVDMPEMDGLEFCRRSKSGHGQHIPVIILTANDADAQRINGLRAGADDYCRKGVSMEELGARIEGILRRSGEAARVRRLFARYTSDAVVDEILRSGDVVLSGERRDVAVLFADIRGFTSRSEQMLPEQVMEFLNEVLGRLADEVLVAGGTLDKFLGDGLMAVFGAPVHRTDDLRRAFNAARGMLKSVEQLDADKFSFGKIELGIGLNFGPVISGSLGNARRLEYTCIGDTVNVASRLCSLAGPGEILAGPTAADILRQEGIDVVPLPPVTLKGKAKPINVFRI